MTPNAHHAHAAYREGQVNASNPVRIVVLLYDGAIRFVRQAMENFDDVAQRGHSLGRAHAILSELMVSLDAEQGGEMVENLDALYRFSLDAMIRSNIDGARDKLPGVVRVLETLAGAWREVELEQRAGDRP